MKPCYDESFGGGQDAASSTPLGGYNIGGNNQVNNTDTPQGHDSSSNFEYLCNIIKSLVDTKLDHLLFPEQLVHGPSKAIGSDEHAPRMQIYISRRCNRR